MEEKESQKAEPCRACSADGRQMKGEYEQRAEMLLGVAVPLGTARAVEAWLSAGLRARCHGGSRDSRRIALEIPRGLHRSESGARLAWFTRGVAQPLLCRWVLRGAAHVERSAQAAWGVPDVICTAARSPRAPACAPRGHLRSCAAHKMSSLRLSACGLGKSHSFRSA